MASNEARKLALALAAAFQEAGWGEVDPRTLHRVGTGNVTHPEDGAMEMVLDQVARAVGLKAEVSAPSPGNADHERAFNALCMSNADLAQMVVKAQNLRELHTDLQHGANALATTLLSVERPPDEAGWKVVQEMATMLRAGVHASFHALVGMEPPKAHEPERTPE